MKKQLLFLILFFCTSFLTAQNFNQPSQFNNVCDDDTDGIASFWLGEISFEILGNLNPQEYIITHHETQTDATIGSNPLSSPYMNLVNNQIIFARIVTVATSDVTILTYQLSVSSGPMAPTLTINKCASLVTTFPCWDLTWLEAEIVQGQASVTVEYYPTLADAQNGSNAFPDPYCYLSPFTTPAQPPVYYRAVFTGSGCFSVGVIELAIITCENQNCPAPTQPIVTNVTENSAFLAWTANANDTTWEVMISSNGNASQPVVVSQNPFVVTGLTCNTTYAFSVRTNCGNFGYSSYSEQVTFQTTACTPEPGQPINIRQCAGSNNLACFDLNQNNGLIINTLNPADYTVTYHSSQVEATNDVNPLSSSYCTTTTQVVFARLENNTTQQFQIFVFYVIVDTFSNVVTPLNNMEECDINNDAFVTFDLTAIQNEINTGNTLEYYPSLSNAQNQVVPFVNPSALNIAVQNPSTSVFVREIVPDGCDNIYSFQLLAYGSCNLGYTCATANSLCNSLGSPFSNTINSVGQSPIGCLGSTPNPTWFYLPISSSGSVNLKITQVANNGSQIDVDYIVHGPFTNPVTPCADQFLLANNIVSCSFSAAAVEYPVIANAQAGKVYLIMVTNYSNLPGLITITELPTSTATIDCSGLRLNAFLDSNNNQQQDNGEQNFPLGQFTYEVNNNGNVHNIVSPNGVYNIYDNNASNTYNLSYTIDPNYASSYNLSTASYSNVQVQVGLGVQTYNFPVTVNQVYNDLEVSIIPVSAPRPGFTYQNKVKYTNNGNQTISSGMLTFNHDALVSILTNTQAGTAPIANGFTFNFSNLLPFESREMTVTLQVPTIPTVALGGLLTNTASIVPLTGDVVPENNLAVNSQIIIGAYDPNDKMEAHGESILHAAFSTNDYLTYTIRFENNGTASAINVRVNDVLNAQLDASTIRMISASHSYVMDRVGNNINWHFDDIMLPPSIANTNIGKGYITFQIKPMPGYAVGDVIPNTASIYFDFNPPIITNTFNTEFVQQLGVGEFENNDFVFYPNPVSDWLTVSVRGNATISSIVVYDVSGKTVFTQQTAGLTTQNIDLSTISKGMYLIEVSTDTKQKVIKKLIVD